MSIKIKFDNRKQSIGFFSAFGMKHIVAALEAAEEADRLRELVKEATASYHKIGDLYSFELVRRERDWKALERLGKLKGKAFDRMMRRADAERLAGQRVRLQSSRMGRLRPAPLFSGKLAEDGVKKRP